MGREDVEYAMASLRFAELAYFPYSVVRYNLCYINQFKNITYWYSLLKIPVYEVRQ